MNLNNLLNIKWRTVNPLDIIKGCAEVYIHNYENLTLDQIAIVKYRIKQCSVCPIYIDGTCDSSKQIAHVSTGQLVNGCGCNILCKTALMNKECPKGAWLSAE